MLKWVRLGVTGQDSLKVHHSRAPQGSVMGPCAYSVYTKDLFMLLSAMCDKLNYVDGNTACCYGDSTDEVIRGLENVACNMVYIK